MTQNNMIVDPNAFVDGQTLTQWVENYERWTFQAPADSELGGGTGPINTVKDPTGAVAEAFNLPGNQMFFITGAPPGVDDRTFNVPFGESVLVPVINRVDSEGPGIQPSIKQFQGTPEQEVNQVLGTFLSNLGPGTATLDGNTPIPLQELDTGIFSAGVAENGSVAAWLLHADAGASLQTTGVAGYFVALENLSPGSHTLTSSFTFAGNTISHTDHIIVGAPTLSLRHERPRFKTSEAVRA